MPTLLRDGAAFSCPLSGIYPPPPPAPSRKGRMVIWSYMSMPPQPSEDAVRMYRKDSSIAQTLSRCIHRKVENQASLYCLNIIFGDQEPGKTPDITLYYVRNLLGGCLRMGGWGVTYHRRFDEDKIAMHRFVSFRHETICKT